MSMNKWINKVKETIKEIESIDPKDRLEYVNGINKCNKAILASYMGWNAWLTNPSIMSGFNEDELKQILSEFKEIATKILRNDVKWTEHMIKKLNVKDEEYDIDTNAQFYVS